MTPRKPYLLLLALTFSALLVHGYHPAAEDGEIYLPGIKKILDPALYPFGAEFFQNHARMTLFGDLIAASVRVSHLSFDVTVFIWHLVAIFLTLLACWELSGDCFLEAEGRWAGVALVAALLTLPVAGTSLYIADQYLTPRSIVLFALLFAVRNALNGRYVRFGAWGAFATAMHPLMAVFGISYGLLVLSMKHVQHAAPRSDPLPSAVMPAIVLTATSLAPAPSEAYREAILTRSYFFILQWQWYEWIGVFAPIVLLLLINRFSRTRGAATLGLISRSLVVYGLGYLAAALVLTVPARFETLARFQPMRSLHLLYVLLVLLGGGMLGAYVLKRRVWRWVLLFAPLCTGMWFAQRELFPSSPHIEWPGVPATNNWIRAFEWIRQNTPCDAVFAIDPEYMRRDDEHGFRAIAERSRLADAVKDSGAVTMFPQPPFAEDWLEQLTAERGWDHFRKADLLRLKSRYGAEWAVLERPGIAGLACPYENPSVLVCRVE